MFDSKKDKKSSLVYFLLKLKENTCKNKGAKPKLKAGKNCYPQSLPAIMFT